MVEINTWVGIILSLAGSVTAAPRAIPQLANQARRDAQKFRGWLAKYLPFLRRSASVSAGVATGWATMGGRGTLTATGRVGPGGSTDEQVRQLWNEVSRLDREFIAVRAEVEEKVAGVRASVSEVRAELQARHSEIANRLERTERESARVNASALPLIGFGILLSSAATDVARLPLWLNIVLLVFVLAGSTRVIVPLLGRGRK